MKVQQIPLPPIGANCYIVTDEKTNHAVVIDPGSCTTELLSLIEGKQVDYILLTHGHFDHILGVTALKEHCSARVAIHTDDAEMLINDKLSYAYNNHSQGQFPVLADLLLEDGDEIKFGEAKLKVMHTPGHSKGSVCYISDKAIFTGDTLFCLTVGRTDLYGGSLAQLIASIDKLMALPGDCVLYTGHNRSTTLQAERNHNRYFRKKNGFIN